MKKNVSKVLALTLSAAAVMAMTTACGSNSSDNASSGSASTETSTSSESTGSSDLSGSVATNGSTSMESVIGAINEKFMQQNPNVNVSYDATGSGTGIEAVSNGTCDVGLSSRALTDEEKSSGLKATTIALDGIAIIVNEKNDIDDLSVDQIADIYTGKVTNWSDVGGSSSGTIAAIGREAGSGTRDGFESITKTEDKCKLKQELTSTGAVIEAVKNSEDAIGYASYASVEGQDGIKVLTVGGVKVNEKNISNGKYVIQRPFNLVTKKDTKLSEQAQAWFDFATSTEVASDIEGAGAVPTATQNK